MVQIQLTDEDFRQALSEAILAQLGTEGQKALIGEAIGKLCEKRKYSPHDRNADKQTLVEELFGDAVSRIAGEIIFELVSKDEEIRTQVEAILRGALQQMLTGDQYSILVNALAASMTKFFSKDRY